MTLGLLSSTPFPPPPPAAWPAAARLLRAPPPSSRLPPVAPSAPRESAVPHARAAGFYKAVSPPLALVFFEFYQNPRVSRLPIVLLSPLLFSYCTGTGYYPVLYRVLYVRAWYESPHSLLLSSIPYSTVIIVILYTRYNYWGRHYSTVFINYDLRVLYPGTVIRYSTRIHSRDNRLFLSLDTN
jgi:hypothetical protein